MASQGCDRKRAIDELLRGQGFAKKLRSMLNQSPPDDGSPPPLEAQHLVKAVSDSFASTLWLLSSSSSNNSSCLTSSDGRKPEDSGDCSKSTCTLSRDRRRGYRRRKTSESWIHESCVLLEDGYGWRKYGQKEILNAKYPRNYLRCTHKYDQGCPANKHVQQIQEKPPLYRTTYHGRHTCKLLLTDSLLLLDSPDPDSKLLSFGNLRQDNDNNTCSSSFFTSFQVPAKQEPVYDHVINSNPDMDVPFDDDDDDDHADVISSSCTTTTTSTTQSFDEIGIMGCVDFDEFEYLA